MSDFYGSWQSFIKQRVTVRTTSGDEINGTVMARDKEVGVILQKDNAELYYLPFATIAYICKKKAEKAAA